MLVPRNLDSAASLLCQKDQVFVAYDLASTPVCALKAGKAENCATVVDEPSIHSRELECVNLEQNTDLAQTVFPPARTTQWTTPVSSSTYGIQSRHQT